MSRELELELTFLAKEIPEGIKNAIPTRITDVYIPDTAEHSHLRLRKRGNLYEITKKTPVKDGDASEQIEQTIPLTKDEFEALISCSQKRVSITKNYKTCELKIITIKPLPTLALQYKNILVYRKNIQAYRWWINY